MKLDVRGRVIGRSGIKLLRSRKSEIRRKAVESLQKSEIEPKTVRKSMIE